MKAFKILFLLILFIAAGCTQRPDGIISPEKIAPVIEEIHLTNAILTNSKRRKSKAEIARHYAYIYQKHGITREDFEKSMTYYAENPKELRETYEDILQRLTARDSIVKVRAKARIDTVELWKGKDSYKWEKYTTETLPVCIPVEYQKTYTISAEIKVYKDAQVKEITPHFIFDALDTTYVWKTKTFKADTVFQKLKISKMVSDTAIFDLSGNFFPAEKENAEQFKHYEIKNIRITTTKTRSEAEIDSILLKKAPVLEE